MSTRVSDYERATEKLVTQVRNMQMPPNFTPKYDMGDMVLRFRSAFMMPDLRAAVLDSDLETLRLMHENYAAGFCAVASYAWAHMFRTDRGEPIWDIYAHNVPINHFWLQNRYDNMILDLTFDQFMYIDGSRPANFVYPYSDGTRKSPFSMDANLYKFGNHIGVDLERMVLTNMFNAITEHD